jgi:hypothetical protein
MSFTQFIHAEPRSTKSTKSTKSNDQDPVTIGTLFEKGTESTVHIPANSGALSCFYVCTGGQIVKFRSMAMLQNGQSTTALVVNCCLPEELELVHTFSDKWAMSAKVGFTGYLIGKVQKILIKGCNTKK